ncbi:MAG: PadR family transcriptional regulator [Candidatus Bathyarchaeota archaeon]|nr:PadR family transcriptional regulator [Candidatus Bathyarchaeum sp.]
MKTCETRTDQNDTKLETKILKEMHERLIRSLLDVIILLKLLERTPLSGYDVIEVIYDELNVSISSGTIYTLLYSMERKELLEATNGKRKRLYSLTEKGENRIKEILQSKKAVCNMLISILQ